MSSNSILDSVADYYSNRLLEHGASPAGVDWNSEESQQLRFEQLLQIVDTSDVEYSLNDWGCGYGALAEHIDSLSPGARYAGFDIAPAMIKSARKRFRDVPNTTFCTRQEDLEVADYTVASGIFNVKLDTVDREWKDYVRTTIAAMSRVSRRGFAFNCLTSYSDPERMVARLHYADPCEIFDHCKRRFSPWVALMHDYGLWEFTILVRASEEGIWQS